jgi:hypothetical protein
MRKSTLQHAAAAVYMQLLPTDTAMPLLAQIHACMHVQLPGSVARSEADAA